MLLYLDSSVALRTIHDVPERDRLRGWLDDRLGAGDVLVSSRLLRTEVIRVLRRDGRPPADGAALLDRVRLVSLSDEVASVAESIQWHTTTPDAVHLATALIIGEPVSVVSHDQTRKAVAAQLGLGVIDPVVRVR